MRSVSAVGGLASLLLCGCVTSAEQRPAIATGFVGAPCAVGVYGSDTKFLTLTRRNQAYRFTFDDGRRGDVGDGGAVRCGDGVVQIDESTILRRRDIRIINTRFDSDGVVLAGQLLEPADAHSGTPLVVLAHGSEESGWIEAVSYPYQLAGRGVSVFVYDKRGTGLSAGTYSQNFPQLADDLVAAAREARRLADGRFGRFGLFRVQPGRMDCADGSQADTG